MKESLVKGRRAHLQVSLLTTTREFLVMSRHNLIPQFLAHINKTTGTPIRIIVLYGGISGIQSADWTG